MAAEKLKRELGFRDVILFYVVTGLSLRWIATAAASGPSAIAIWIIAWCGFFLPLAGCVLELSSRYPQEGGLYVWTREAYGEFAGFMAAWTYWMSNLPYFPAVLYFAASSLLFATPRAQHLAQYEYLLPALHRRHAGLHHRAERAWPRRSASGLIIWAPWAWRCPS